MYSTKIKSLTICTVFLFSWSLKKPRTKSTKIRGCQMAVFAYVKIQTSLKWLSWFNEIEGFFIWNISLLMLKDMVLIEKVFTHEDSELLPFIIGLQQEFRDLRVLLGHDENEFIFVAQIWDLWELGGNLVPEFTLRAI